MAITARALHRLPLHLTPALACPFCAVSPAATAATASAKVSDRIVRVLAIDLDSGRQEVVGLSVQTLLRALANAGLIDSASHHLDDIDANSAECEVHIAQECLEKLPPPSYEELYVLTWASRNRELNKHARLGCQCEARHVLCSVCMEKLREVGYALKLGNFCDLCCKNTSNCRCVKLEPMTQGCWCCTLSSSWWFCHMEY